MERLNLKIEGMSCGHCVARVQKSLSKVEGVHVGQVEIGSAWVTYDPSRVGPEQIRQAVEDAGYEIRPAEEAVA